MSNLCPVYKKKSKNLKKNYRPISLLPILAKIFEKSLFFLSMITPSTYAEAAAASPTQQPALAMA